MCPAPAVVARVSGGHSVRPRDEQTAGTPDRHPDSSHDLVTDRYQRPDERLAVRRSTRASAPSTSSASAATSIAPATSSA